MKIDIFPHIFPKAYFDRMVEVIPNQDAIRRWTHIPILYEIEARLEMMKQWPDYQQILTLSMPAIEFVAPAERSPELARLANDGMADLCAKHPAQFPGWVASVPMNNVAAAIAEIERAIEKMGARGIQIFTNVNGRPLDDPEFAPIFARMADYDLPIWMHPTRPSSHSDYASEEKSRFDIWWVFGWPYETSAAMARMVFAGFFDRWPNLKIITHHLGAMVPYLEARVGLGLDQLGKREGAEPGYSEIIAAMKRKGKRPVDYFREFYGDTAINGSMSGTRCGIDFFGSEHVLFGTDCPFDPEGGPLFIREIIKTLDALDLSVHDRDLIYHGNAERMLRLGQAPHYHK
ncbi:MAG: amidohydrolase family protein [Stellaceae bacterium]